MDLTFHEILADLRAISRRHFAFFGSVNENL